MVDPASGGPRDPDQDRQIRFVATPTGPRVAYATVGRGPALIVPAAWIGHLEVGWQDPAIRAFYAPIAAWRTVVAYDKPGCGLSDPWPAPQTLDSDLEVLGAVTNHLELDQVDLLGLSMGAPVSLAYAARHPRRVGRLILYGGFADGHQVASAEVRAAMVELVRAHWGLGSDVLADIFLPTPARRPSCASPNCSAGPRTPRSPASCWSSATSSGSTTCWTAWPRPRWCCTDATTGPSPTAWAAIWRPGSRGRGWCRWPAAATFPISATPRPWSGRSWGSWAHPTRAAWRRARAPTGRAHRPPAPGRGPGRRRPDQPPDRRPAGDRGALGRGPRGAYPPAPGRAIASPDRCLVGLGPRQLR